MARMPTRIEFYKRHAGMVVACEGDAVPRKGEFVSISKRTWKVVAITWAVDQPGGTVAPSLRACVEMDEVEP